MVQTSETVTGQAREAAAQAGRRVRGEARTYEHGHDQPLGGYLGAGAAYLGLSLALAGLGRLTGRRPPERYAAGDVVLGGLACHKFARLVTKDAVTSPVRAPFTRFQGPAGSAEVQEEVRGDGVRHAVGELLSCPFCLAPWIATGYVAGLALVPGAARTWAATFSVVGVSDLLQQVYGRLRED